MTVLGVFSGKVGEEFGLTTAMVKNVLKAPSYLNVDGLDDDECADQKHHGGPERAIPHYPSEHYQYWADYYGAQNQLRAWEISSMGENISTRGYTEENVCIGDRYQWGDAIIEVSQPRSPCFKLNNRWQLDDFSLKMQTTHRCGWLYRVIKPGVVSNQSTFKRIYRVNDAMTIAQVCSIYFDNPLDKDGLTRLQQQPLSQSWLHTINYRLSKGEVENWNFRLFGAAER